MLCEVENSNCFWNIELLTPDLMIIAGTVSNQSLAKEKKHRREGRERGWWWWELGGMLNEEKRIEPLMPVGCSFILLH